MSFIVGSHRRRSGPHRNWNSHSEIEPLINARGGVLLRCRGTGRRLVVIPRAAHLPSTRRSWAACAAMTAHSCKLSDYFFAYLLARKKPLAINVARAGEGMEAAEVRCKQIVDHQV